MAVEKLSISMDPELAARAREYASSRGESLSAWIARAVARENRLQAGRQGVRAYEAELGEITAEEKAEAARILDAAGLRQRFE